MRCLHGWFCALTLQLVVQEQAQACAIHAAGQLAMRRCVDKQATADRNLLLAGFPGMELVCERLLIEKLCFERLILTLTESVNRTHGQTGDGCGLSAVMFLVMIDRADVLVYSTVFWLVQARQHLVSLWQALEVHHVKRQGRTIQ